MRRRTVLLATASLVYGSPNVFSVHDDLLAFPQYEVIFADTYVSDTDAESRLVYASSSSLSKAKSTTLSSHNAPRSQETAAELSTRSYSSKGSTGSGYESANAAIPTGYEYMMLDHAPYLCSIPQISVAPRNQTAAAQSKAEEEKELARAVDRGWDLLKDMEGQCMYFISGWWSYSFCYNQHVKQFHQLPPGRGGIPPYPPVEDEATPSYVLGRFDARKEQGGRIDGQQKIGSSTQDSPGGLEVAELQAKGDMRYLVQKLDGGTTCDLTGKPRKVQIQFHCHPHSTDRIGWIKEISTCSYLMVIYTPRLCNDVAFLPPRETKAHPIVCQEIVPDEEIDDWEIRKAAEAERKELGTGSKANSRPMVGDIEVGGMKLVGKDGQRIELPKVAQRKEGAKADIVARSDPKEKGGKVQKLSNEDLKKMDLDPAMVETLRKELEELAGDRGWTLEIVDVLDGVRELRGIVDGDEDEDDGKGEGESDEGNGDEGSEEIFKDEL